jgi:hypothetical protein
VSVARTQSPARIALEQRDVAGEHDRGADLGELVALPGRSSQHLEALALRRQAGAAAVVATISEVSVIDQ